MSKYNLQNPGQYKIAGRERPNTVASERMRATRSKPLRNSTKQGRKGKPAKQR